MSRTLVNFKVIGQRSRSHGFFRVRATAATRGQYLALSKAWWSRWHNVCDDLSMSGCDKQRHAGDAAVHCVRV